MSENYMVINGKKIELTDGQLKQLGIEVEMKRNNPFEKVKLGETYYYIKSGDECKKCHIKYNEHSRSWELPDTLKPTEKQKRTLLFIENRLNVRGDNLITKKQYCDFIGKYFDKAKIASCGNNYFEDNYEEFGYVELF